MILQGHATLVCREHGAPPACASESGGCRPQRSGSCHEATRRGSQCVLLRPWSSLLLEQPFRPYVHPFQEADTACGRRFAAELIAIAIASPNKPRLVPSRHAVLNHNLGVAEKGSQQPNDSTGTLAGSKSPSDLGSLHFRLRWRRRPRGPEWHVRVSRASASDAPYPSIISRCSAVLPLGVHPI